MLLIPIFWTVEMVPPLLVVTCVHADAPIHILLSAIATLFMLAG